MHACMDTYTHAHTHTQTPLALNMAPMTPIHMEIMCHQEASTIGKVDSSVASHALTCFCGLYQVSPFFQL